MTTPALELAQELALLGVTGPFGGDGDFSVHVSREPMEPADVVTLYDTGGAELIDVEEQFRRPSIQVRTRSTDYEAGYAMQQAIFAALSIPTERQIGNHWYVAVDLVADILSIGRDEHDRFLLTANYLLERQPVAAPLIFTDNFDAYADGTFVSALADWEEFTNVGPNTIQIENPAGDGAIMATQNAQAWVFPRRSLYQFNNDQYAEATLEGSLATGTAALALRFTRFAPPITTTFSAYRLSYSALSGTWNILGAIVGPQSFVRPVVAGTRVRFEARGQGIATRLTALIDEGAGFVPILAAWMDFDPLLYIHGGTPAFGQLSGTPNSQWDDAECGDLID